jgi:hypothetical protein
MLYVHINMVIPSHMQVLHKRVFFFEIKAIYIKLASRLIKNLPVSLDTLVRKRVRQKLAASITIRLLLSARCRSPSSIRASFFYGWSSSSAYNPAFRSISIRYSTPQSSLLSVFDQSTALGAKEKL